MLELRIMAEGKPLPLFDLPAALGKRGAAKEVADQISMLISFLDDLGGDPDAEDGDDDDLEPTGDEADASYSEWHTRGSHKLVAGAEMRVDERGNWHEDSEDDDPDTCLAGDDGTAPFMTYYGPRSGSVYEDSDGEEDACAEGVTWPEGINQPSCMTGWLGGDGRADDRLERNQVPAEWPLPVANDR